MSCKTIRFSGLAACEKYLSRINGAEFLKSNLSFTDAEFLSLAKTTTDIATDENSLAIPGTGWEKTTDDVEIQVANTGEKYKTQNPIPSGILYFKGNKCDYDLLAAYEGQTMYFVPYLKEDNMKLGTRYSDGSIHGFKCTIAIKKDAPESDNAQQSYPIYLFFDNSDEWGNVAVATLDYSFGEVSATVPAGLNLQITTPYAASVVSVKVTKRCNGEAYTGLDAAADWPLFDPSVADTGVELVSEVGFGFYDLTIQKNVSTTPVTLAANEFVGLRAEDKSGGATILFVSQIVKVVA